MNMNYAEKFNMVKEEVRPSLPGEYLFVGVTYASEDEIPEIVNLIPDFEKFPVIEEAGWKFKVCKYESEGGKTVTLIAMDDDHENERVSADLMYEICKKNEFRYEYFSIRNAVVDLAAIAPDNSLEIAKTLYNSLQSFPASFVTLRYPGYADKTITITDVNGMSHDYKNHTIFLINNRVYDILNGYLEVNVYDYFQNIYKDNSAFRVRHDQSMLHTDWTQNFTPAEIRFWNSLTEPDSCLSSKEYLEAFLAEE